MRHLIRIPGLSAARGVIRRRTTTPHTTARTPAEEPCMHSDGHDGSTRGLATLGAAARTPELLAELTIPAEADSLGLARLAALHVAGLLGVPVSRLAELRLAVNEACALLFHNPAAAAAERVAA